jgi:hypothetical protein
VGACTVYGKTGQSQVNYQEVECHYCCAHVIVFVMATARRSLPPMQCTSSLPPLQQRILVSASATHSFVSNRIILVNRLVAKLHPFPGMQHLDVAGGTGDVARRVQNAIDRACQDAAKHPHDPILEARPPSAALGPRGSNITGHGRPLRSSSSP